MYADTSIWLTPLFSQTQTFYLYISLTNVYKSRVPSFQQPYEDCFVFFICRNFFCQVSIKFLSLCFCLNQALMLWFTSLFYNSATVCHVILWLYVFLPGFICILRKWEVFPTCNSLYASFFFSFIIQLLLDEYLWPLNLWSLQQSGAEAHPTAPHLGEPPKYLHFCKHTKTNPLCIRILLQLCHWWSDLCVTAFMAWVIASTEATLVLAVPPLSLQPFLKMFVILSCNATLSHTGSSSRSVTFNCFISGYDFWVENSCFFLKCTNWFGKIYCIKAVHSVNKFIFSLPSLFWMRFG